MRNYEIVFLVHPDQSDQTSSIISKLDKLIKDSGGNVHRSENIGVSIKKCNDISVLLYST